MSKNLATLRDQIAQLVRAHQDLPPAGATPPQYEQRKKILESLSIQAMSDGGAEMVGQLIDQAIAGGFDAFVKVEMLKPEDITELKKGLR